MGLTSISALGLQLFATSNLMAQQTQLATLSEQLASNQQHSNLTDYTPLDASQLLNFQNSITQRQSYVSSMKVVSARLDVYDSTMTDMESIASQAAQLANQNPSQDPSKTGIIQQQVVAFMQQAVSDLKSAGRQSLHLCRDPLFHGARKSGHRHQSSRGSFGDSRNFAQSAGL